jgi:protein-disulfide isomerase
LRISIWTLLSLAGIACVVAWFALKHEATDTRGALASHGEQVFRDPDSPVGGNPEGGVTLVEFFDYNCPYCRQMSAVIAEAEAADPGLRIVYKEWPVLGAGSEFAAKAALAASRQDKFVAFHRALYRIRGEVDESKVLTTAESIGLDPVRLKSDLRDSAIATMLKRNLALADALGIDGTPGFVIGDRILVGPMQLNALQTVIASARRS